MERNIYKIIEKSQLEDILQAFFVCVKIPIQLLDEHGVILISFGGMNDYCSFIQKFLKPGETCAAFHQKAAANALQIGEAYTFTCHSDLNHIIYPLVRDGILLGSVLVGPFLMETPDASMLGAVSDRYRMDTQDALALYEAATSICIVTPQMVTQLNHLLLHLFSNLTGAGADPLHRARSKAQQQSSISMAIHSYKAERTAEPSHYPFEKENLLIRKVRAGNVAEAKDILNDLLGYVLFTSGYSLISAKTRSMELCTILSRSMIDAGADETRIMEESAAFLNRLNDIHDLDTLCFYLQELTEFYISLLFPDNESRDRLNSDLIQTAVAYIQQHFREDLKLQDVADHVFLNASYFSSLFKQATGSGFKEYLTDIRIEEARQMLVNSNASIVEVALSCGFSSQSYFSKIFKARTGFSPKSFRN